MAYLAEVSVVGVGSRQWRVTITEAEAAIASEAKISKRGMPKRGRILRRSITLISGTGAQVDPHLRRTPTASGTDLDIVESAWTDAPFTGPIATGVNAASGSDADPVEYYSETGDLYHSSVVDAGADNVIQTEYLIEQVG